MRKKTLRTEITKVFTETMNPVVRNIAEILHDFDERLKKLESSLESDARENSTQHDQFPFS
jgi:hypothetical protein